MIVLLLCLAGAVLNIAFNRICIMADIPLYMDTVLTVAVTLACGLFWGALCGALTNLIHQAIWFWGWEGYLFALCSIATAYITWLFIRIFPRELRFAAAAQETVPPPFDSMAALKSSRLNMVMGRVIVLILLSFALCLAMSILGGALTAFILALNPSHSGERGLSVFLSAIMFGSYLPALLTEILSRIPINIIDRLISVFGGFGIALAMRRLLRSSS